MPEQQPPIRIVKPPQVPFTCSCPRCTHSGLTKVIVHNGHRVHRCVVCNGYVGTEGLDMLKKEADSRD